ncbi:polyphosphate kinase 1 [Candidatus Methylospira mobilis]|uniref:Polyphosphate kinase n=1 Tax=Candidatus Methylospira mobilis TaxID=1808979 RepID=A0A5Q0BMF7_9GAMM|nr:polyphosphate kinase 1 [Candidatus Methylospira mobilis]QFY44930.1 polyphosphate kinase 1 [Candidatus Methylospira mobilis]
MVDLTAPELYINKELSLLEFNWRVLEQARSGATPLLERLNFLCISCSNMDEFFEVRVAGLIQRAELASEPPEEPDALPTQEVLARISQRAHELVAEQYRVFNEVLLPQLAAESIRFIRRAKWSAAQRSWLQRYFRDELLPMLSPLGLDPSHPFPRLLNKSLNFIVPLSGKDAFGRDIHMAVLQAPRSLPRIVPLPPKETGSGPHDFVFLSSIIHAFAEELFQGVQVLGCYQFRVTRNSDMYLDEEEVDDLLQAVEGELTARNYGDAVRLEVANCPEDIAALLMQYFELSTDRLYRVNGPVNLSRAREVYDQINRPDLKFPVFTPSVAPALAAHPDDFFAAIREHDILLHHPYESFASIIELIHQAADDPQVVAIKQTLYRTGINSPIVEALLRAARAGKEVAVVVELLARFDEQANISLAHRLQEAGVQVVYGIVGYKTHAKMLLILRREDKKIGYYTHLGTGNYHSRTSRLYTDYGLLTHDRVMGEDVRRVFLQLTSLGQMTALSRVLQSPFTLHSTLIGKIDREIEHVKQGRVGRIVIKVNSVDEPQLIRALYRASMAGVKIILLVRGLCCLRPGVPGVSDNIEVRSVIGRFLEHSRIYWFANDGEDEIYAASADMMVRNMFRRVETAFPIVDPDLSARLKSDMELYLQDNTLTWILNTDGSYLHVLPAEGEPVVAVQSALLQQLAERVS